MWTENASVQGVLQLLDMMRHRPPCRPVTIIFHSAQTIAFLWQCHYKQCTNYNNNQTSAITRVPRLMQTMLFVPHNPELWPSEVLTWTKMGFQDSWWNISMSSLVILAASIFGMLCGKQTHICHWKSYHATTVSINNNKNNNTNKYNRLWSWYSTSRRSNFWHRSTIRLTPITFILTENLIVPQSDENATKHAFPHIHKMTHCY